MDRTDRTDGSAGLNGRLGERGISDKFVEGERLAHSWCGFGLAQKIERPLVNIAKDLQGRPRDRPSGSLRANLLDECERLERMVVVVGCASGVPGKEAPGAVKLVGELAKQTGKVGNRLQDVLFASQLIRQRLRPQVIVAHVHVEPEVVVATKIKVELETKQLVRAQSWVQVAVEP